MKYEEAKELKPEEFKRLSGVRIETFETMVKIVKEAVLKKKKPGRPSHLSIENQIMLTLEYWREYRTYFHIGAAWGLHESNAYRTIKRIEDILVKSKQFRLPGKKSLSQEELAPDSVIIDVTENGIERPKKKQKKYFSGKKKRHVIKVQTVSDAQVGFILCNNCDKGKKHDFRMFKESELGLRGETEVLADKGYQGIQKLHSKSTIPYKKKRKGKLTKEEREHNRKLASKRILGEHIFCRIKVFRIFKGDYRNRRKRFGLRFNLISGIYNFELTLPKFKPS